MLNQFNQRPPAPGAPQPAAPMAPARPSAPFAPPAAAPQRNFWAFINGAATLVNEQQARTLPPTTMGMDEAQTIPWTAFAQLLPAAPAPAAQGFYQPPAPAQPVTAAGLFPAPAQQHQQYSSTAPANLFSGVANADVTRRGNNMNEGDYLARFIKAEYKEGQNGTYVICEVEFVASTYDPADPSRAKCNQIGSRANVFVKRNQNFDGNIKEVMLALSPHNADGSVRSDDAIVPQHETAALLTDPCPYAGQFVYLEAREVMTKGSPGNPSKPFTRISWWHCPKDAAGNPDTTTMAAKYR